MAEAKTHTGCCHCGAVRYEAGALCNCARSTRFAFDNTLSPQLSGGSRGSEKARPSVPGVASVDDGRRDRSRSRERARS